MRRIIESVIGFVRAYLAKKRVRSLLEFFVDADVVTLHHEIFLSLFQPSEELRLKDVLDRTTKITNNLIHPEWHKLDDSENELKIDVLRNERVKEMFVDYLKLNLFFLDYIGSKDKDGEYNKLENNLIEQGVTERIESEEGFIQTCRLLKKIT